MKLDEDLNDDDDRTPFHVGVGDINFICILLRHTHTHTCVGECTTACNLIEPKLKKKKIKGAFHAIQKLIKATRHRRDGRRNKSRQLY